MEEVVLKCIKLCYNLFINEWGDIMSFLKETEEYIKSVISDCGYSLDNIFESQNRSELSFGYKVSNYFYFFIAFFKYSFFN